MKEDEQRARHGEQSDTLEKGCKAPVFAVSPHRINIDGKGVVTLVCFGGCPLNCRYCINHAHCFDPKKWHEYSPEQLYERVKKDNLYFLATGGGITFGGGEPLLRAEFIRQFRTLCGKEWKLNVETSLNVPSENVESLLDVVDYWIVDVKDMNPDIYRAYTGAENSRVVRHLQLLAERGKAEETVVKVPLIKDYNTEADRKESMRQLRQLGFSRFDMLEYKVRE